MEDVPIPPHSKSNTARTSMETAAEAEVQRENVRHANPNGFSTTDAGIDVKAAEAEFATLQRELSGLSHASRRISRIHSKQQGKSEKAEDEEKATTDSLTDEEQFDLETTLRGNHTVCDMNSPSPYLPLVH
jgi:ATP-binding cassette subfamily G (WHITE) protein 2 (SNQ2)